MADAHIAVPCWIMPHHRVSESLPAELGNFDLVIIDEASQSDAWALPAILRGKKILVVGDDKQVSPAAVGVSEKEVLSLQRRFLNDLPYGNLLSGDRSIYDWASTRFATDALTLHEHFRCVEPIIQFSNHQFYDDNIKPLRIPSASERIDPPLIDVFVKGGYRRGKSKVNPPEADAIIDEVKNIVQDPAFSTRTIGVISLLGSDQAREIYQRLTAELGGEEMLKHDIRCGDAMTFQGKEADIVMISMVATPDQMKAATGKGDEQRFNVAASRARDRLYLFRSFERSDLSEADLRARLLDHFIHPFHQDEKKVGSLRELCESDFERDVYDELVARGYRVTPQVRAGQYRIDLVVEGEDDRRLAVELDGDRYHTVDRWAEDAGRQRILERMGWRFWRCWGSSYIRDREGCLDDLINTLKEMGIEPLGAAETDFSELCEHRVIEVDGESGEAFAETGEVEPDDEEVLLESEDEMEVVSEPSVNEATEDVAVLPEEPAPSHPGEDYVRVGDVITYIDLAKPEVQETIQIVSGASNGDLGIINQKTALAQSLLGVAIMDEVEVVLPHKTRKLKVISIVHEENKREQIQVEKRL